MSTFSYIPHTSEDRRKMLEFLHISDTDELFSDIPDAVRMNRPLQLPPAMAELTLERHMLRLAGRNMHAGQVVNFLGAGSYQHYRPSVIDAIVGRSEFYTSYTPYQPEISQGMLQAIFEYQTMVSELTGMDLANASMYDGPTALAEAGLVCCAHTRRNKLVVLSTVHPEYRAVIETYAKGQSLEVVEVPFDRGVVTVDGLAQILDSTTAGVLVQYPNFFGNMEDLRSMADLAHAAGALFVVSAYPIALGLLESPGVLGADIVVAEGQSLGNSLSYGGPYLGMMAARQDLMRKLPGRIVGQTTDAKGRRGFVLTLQAREQHIRREKASSNICSNQALNALAATVFLSYLGPKGMRELALQNYHKAHYFQSKLTALPGVEAPFAQPFFNEFVVRVPHLERIQEEMLNRGYFFGLNLETYYPELKDCVLLTVTEVRTKEELDEAAAELEGLL
ncbi:putative glycine dehydrogenase (decarboxylating) subunit 1 [Alicyclobacillus contaminans]|uniref:aminomethyl-transferring glycine dehydrogenase subunit GcvPA n=1 Tax=Alicyclobacillus contaminans TaxID=392016 RepID=UPI00041DB856|nr:aminomethyl-transferring glycine dehydrogenase subunit GcvPA [Alicyclobacillus contaminans]GMA52381.1 putative glycine dehydrogenase (decarboxylating) subunit 1 [Alicyclobacillus contaminans]